MLRNFVQRRATAASVPVFVLLAFGLALSTVLAHTGEDPDELLLYNKFGELCTMCEATVVCASGKVADITLRDLEQPGDRAYTLYHFHTKTFLGQIATIYDYLIRWIEPVITEKRPLTIYAIPAAGAGTAERARIETWVELSLEPPLITIDDRQIERVSREWRQPDGEAIGACRRLPLRETWTFIKANAPWPERVSARAAGAAP